MEGLDLPRGPWLTGLRHLATTSEMLHYNLRYLAAPQLETLALYQDVGPAEELYSVVKWAAGNCPRLSMVYMFTDYRFDLSFLPPSVTVKYTCTCCDGDGKWVSMCQQLEAKALMRDVVLFLPGP